MPNPTKTEEQKTQTPDEESVINSLESYTQEESPWDEDGETGEKKQGEKEEKTSEQGEKGEEEEKSSGEEEKPEEKPEEKGEEEEKTPEEIEQARLEEIAKEEGKTIDEVKADLEKDKTIAERHQNDPVKLARALRKEESEYGKINNEVEELRAFKSRVEREAQQFQEQRLDKELEKNRDEVIEKYLEKFPEVQAEDLSDDAIFERAKAHIHRLIEEQQKALTEKMAAEASAKKADVIKSLPEEYKDYVPEIKEIIDELDPATILDKEFDPLLFANYVRGVKFTPEYVKSLEDAAYKRGTERAKIVPPGGKASRPTGKKNQSVSLTEAQKDRAIEIYGRREGWSREQMYEEYIKNDLEADSQW